jgi:hypothetical protein
MAVALGNHMVKKLITLTVCFSLIFSNILGMSAYAAPSNSNTPDPAEIAKAVGEITEVTISSPVVNVMVQGPNGVPTPMGVQQVITTGEFQVTESELHRFFLESIGSNTGLGEVTVVNMGAKGSTAERVSKRVSSQLPGSTHVDFSPEETNEEAVDRLENRKVERTLGWTYVRWIGNSTIPIAAALFFAGDAATAFQAGGIVLGLKAMFGAASKAGMASQIASSAIGGAWSGIAGYTNSELGTFVNYTLKSNLLGLKSVQSFMKSQFPKMAAKTIFPQSNAEKVKRTGIMMPVSWMGLEYTFMTAVLASYMAFGLPMVTDHVTMGHMMDAFIKLANYTPDLLGSQGEITRLGMELLNGIASNQITEKMFTMIPTAGISTVGQGMWEVSFTKAAKSRIDAETLALKLGFQDFETTAKNIDRYQRGANVGAAVVSLISVSLFSLKEMGVVGTSLAYVVWGAMGVVGFAHYNLYTRIIARKAEKRIIEMTHEHKRRIEERRAAGLPPMCGASLGAMPKAG